MINTRQTLSTGTHTHKRNQSRKKEPNSEA